MARLIVEAVTDEKHDMKLGFLKLIVSVSRADDGKPVTGLTKTNFRITNLGIEPTATPDVVGSDYTVLVGERKWDPGDNESSGVYDMSVSIDFGKFLIAGEFMPGENFSFGIQARTFAAKPGTFISAPVDFGQTVVMVTSLSSLEE